MRKRVFRTRTGKIGWPQGLFNKSSPASGTQPRDCDKLKKELVRLTMIHGFLWSMLFKICSHYTFVHFSKYCTLCLLVQQTVK
jgi:hypothetical protein